MRRKYAGMEAHVIEFDPTSVMLTEYPGYSGCDSIVGYHNMGFQCDSPEDERAVYWVSPRPIGGL